MSIFCIFETKMQYLYFFLQQVFLNKTKTLTCETLKNHIHAFFFASLLSKVVSAHDRLRHAIKIKVVIFLTFLETPPP